MSVYMTEEEQLAAIKNWWNKYNYLITVFLSLLLLLMVGYKYWNWHQEKISTHASIAYEQLILAYANQDNNAVQSYANQLINDFSQTVYAHAARLILAKIFITHDQSTKARENLEYVAAHAKLRSLKQVARLRLARLLAAQKAYDKALAKLAKVEDPAYMPVINELRGDIYAATGKYQQAIQSYKKAITETRTSGVGNLFLEMKTNELAARTQSMNTSDPTLQAA